MFKYTCRKCSYQTDIVQNLKTINGIFCCPECSSQDLLKSPIFPAEGKIRTFETGATRDTESSKLDFEGFLSPLVLERYARYLHKHRIQSDGKLRDGDNWQRGIPKKTYMKSLCRHLIAVWLIHRGYVAKDNKGSIVDLEDSLCAVIFNSMGYLFEILKEKQSNEKT